MVGLSIANIFIAFIIGFIPSIIWLFFFLQEDRLRPEPKKLIAKVFLAGALMIIPAFIIQKIFVDISGREQYSLPFFIFFGIIEEFLKFLAAYFVIHKRKEFDEPIDAMIYMITVALGFAAIENIASAFKSLTDINGIDTLQSLTLRFAGATLLHALASASIGYFWGKSIVDKNSKHTKLIIIGLIIASLLHGVFNYLILKTGPIGSAIIFLVIIAFFIFQDFEKLKYKYK